MNDNRDSLAAQQAAQLRKLADVVEANPDLIEHFKNAFSYIGAHVFEDVVPAFAAFARSAKAAGAEVTKDYNQKYAKVTASWGVVRFNLQADRDAVCERVVVATREVTEEVPDPDAPKVTVTHMVEDVEWVCRPLLAAGTETAVA